MRTGKMGFGNKGAVMVRMRVFDEPLAAVCAHLASGEAPADALKRQADFMQICRTGTFGAAGDEGQTILHAPLEADPTCAPHPSTSPVPHKKSIPSTRHPRQPLLDLSPAVLSRSSSARTSAYCSRLSSIGPGYVAGCVYGGGQGQLVVSE